MYVILLQEIGDIHTHECTKLYANGCLPRMFYLIYQSAGLLGAGALTIAFIQVSTICFTHLLYIKISVDAYRRFTGIIGRDYQRVPQIYAVFSLQRVTRYAIVAGR
jgi:hypothetical protein